jgi:hypothetical protein
VDIVPALVTDAKAAQLVLPSQRALHDPAVASESILGLNAGTGDAGGNAAQAKPAPVLPGGVGLVCVEFSRAEAMLP